MKTLTTIAAFLASASAYLINVPTLSPTRYQTPEVTSSGGWVHLQKLILPLFEDVCEDSTNPIIVRLAQEFDFNKVNGDFGNPEVIGNYQNLISGKGLLPKREIFTEYNVDHMSELKALFDVLYFAKDFDTFYNVAAWARQNVNCGVFVDAIYVAIVKRRDTQRLSIPAPYELLPNYFINKDAVVKASLLLSGEELDETDMIRDDGNAYIIDVDYTSAMVENDDSELAYFREDIGINTFYFLEWLRLMPWLNGTSTENNCGVRIYNNLKQLVGRYNLERYANGLPDLENLRWEELTNVIYDSMLIYSNGHEFGQRSTHVDLANEESLSVLQTIENSLPTIVSRMTDSGYNKTQILDHIMEILVTSDHSYQNVARTLLNKNIATNNGDTKQLSVLDHYVTTLRDPVFWLLTKKIVDLVDDAFTVFPGYTKNDLIFPGVEILNIDVKKMMTSFDTFEFDVTDALKTPTYNATFRVKISQKRLNHKPFTIKLNVSSLVTQKAFVKIFLGPKILPSELIARKNSFVLLNDFEVSLKKGINVISKSSDDFKYISDDFKSLRTLRKNVEDAEYGLDVLPLTSVDSLFRYPSRLLLPKGVSSGLPVHIFVYISPFVKSFSMNEFNSDLVFSPGFPLDLDISESKLFELPNAMIKEISITHKGSDGSDYNSQYERPASRNWQERPVRPEFTQRKEPFDYKSKRGQYGKKEDYASKRGNYNKKVVTEIEDTETTTVPVVIEEKLNEKVTLNKDTKVQNIENTEEDLTTVTAYEIVNESKTIDGREGIVSDEDLLKVRPIHIVKSSKKQEPKVFDYLLPARTEDSNESQEKVYMY